MLSFRAVHIMPAQVGDGGSATLCIHCIAIMHGLVNPRKAVLGSFPFVNTWPTARNGNLVYCHHE